MTRVGCSAIIIGSADRDPVITRVHGNVIARLVICCLAINVILNLTPGQMRIRKCVRDAMDAVPSPPAPIATRSPVAFIETDWPDASSAASRQCQSLIASRQNRCRSRCALDLRYFHCHCCYAMHQSRPGHRPSSSRLNIGRHLLPRHQCHYRVASRRSRCMSRRARDPRQKHVTVSISSDHGRSPVAFIETDRPKKSLRRH